MRKHSEKGLVTVLGIELVKRSFQLHGVDTNGEVVLRKKLNHNKLATFIAQFRVCLTRRSRNQEVVK